MPPHSENQKKHDPHEIEGVKSRHARASSLRWWKVIILMVFFMVLGGVLASVFKPYADKVYRKLIRFEAADKEVTEEVDAEPEPKAKAPASPPKPKEPVIRVPSDYTISSGGDIRKMSRGIQLNTMISLEKGGLASIERNTDESFSAHYELKIKLPKASVTLAELEKNTPMLKSMLPGLEVMVPKAKISEFFFQLYENKAKRLKLKTTQLNELMTRHNFYDCETILNLKHPDTGQRVMLMQAEMDVVSDGSDGDRLPVMPDKIVNSTNYQPLTSYGWRKTGKSPNPLIAGWKNRIRKADAEIARADTKDDRRAWLQSRVLKIKREIKDMESRSFLVADYDPFIVMPINMLTAIGNSEAVRVGDYAVVIYEGKVYPTIVGDAGPSYKVGEASLRFCKQINPKAGIYSRPVSDLTVTYLVFPGSRDSFREPNYNTWEKRCKSLLAEVGGLGEGVLLHSWQSTFPSDIK
ncbi:MAG: glycoside hydrolase family 75 protein [Akkermansiaceae bacterium]|nr:glycoside hydrolase family 75 protein [Akkermansiaceae bacterium]